MYYFQHARLTVIALSILLGGCQSPLQKAIAQIAPDYSAKSPSSDKAMLGHRIVSAGLDVVTCYQGKLDPETANSWGYIELIYTGNAKGDLSTDFGNTLKVAAGGESDINTKIALERLTEDQLTELYMNPKSTCAASRITREQYLADSGSVDKVVVRAVRADKLTTSSLEKFNGRVEANLPVIQGVPVHATFSGSSTNQASWEGTQLYFAHLIQPFRTTLESKTFNEIPVPGVTPKIQECAFKVTGLGSEAWTGDLSCDGGGQGLDNLQAKLDEPDGRQTAPGVSYSVIVSRSPRVGFVNVEISKWVVEQVK